MKVALFVCMLVTLLACQEVLGRIKIIRGKCNDTFVDQQEELYKDQCYHWDCLNDELKDRHRCIGSMNRGECKHCPHKNRVKIISEKTLPFPECCHKCKCVE